MKIELPEESKLFWNVLRTVTDNSRTAEDIWRNYTGKHPAQSIIGNKKITGRDLARTFFRTIVPVTSLQDIEAVLNRLLMYEFVVKGVTRYTDRALREDVRIYCLSNKGRNALLIKGNKTRFGHKK